MSNQETFWDADRMVMTGPGGAIDLTVVAACPGGCDHTVQEHVAFDHGLRAGQDGEEDSANPYTDYGLQEAWWSGHSVGALNRRSKCEPHTGRVSEPGDQKA